MAQKSKACLWALTFRKCHPITIIWWSSHSLQAVQQGTKVVWQVGQVLVSTSAIDSFVAFDNFRMQQLIPGETMDMFLGLKSRLGKAALSDIIDKRQHEPESVSNQRPSRYVGREKRTRYCGQKMWWTLTTNVG